MIKISRHGCKMCKSLINKALLKLTALNKVFLSAVVLCVALLSAPVASAAETPKLNSGSSIDGNEMLLTYKPPQLSPPGMSPSPSMTGNVMKGFSSKMGRSGGGEEAAVVGWDGELCESESILSPTSVSFECREDAGITYVRLDGGYSGYCNEITGLSTLDETQCEVAMDVWGDDISLDSIDNGNLGPANCYIIKSVVYWKWNAASSGETVGSFWDPICSVD
jgi:hypothetical protein